MDLYIINIKAMQEIVEIIAYIHHLLLKITQLGQIWLFGMIHGTNTVKIGNNNIDPSK